MKQELLCPKCSEEMNQQFVRREPFPGEYVKMLMGTALADYICDHCSAPIVMGMPCGAFSIWTTKNPFIMGWELRYINPGGTMTMRVPKA